MSDVTVSAVNAPSVTVTTSGTTSSVIASGSTVGVSISAGTPTTLLFLPTATTTSLGAIIVGGGLSVSNGTLSASNAVTSVAGRTGVVTLTTADISGLTAYQPAGDYATLTGGKIPVAMLSTATTSSAGAVIVGSGLSVDSTGKISATGAVTSVAGRTGTVTLTKSDVGLGSVDNTSDTAKPVSTATQTALDGKAATSHTHAIANVTGLQTALDGKQAAGSYAASSHAHGNLSSAGLVNGNTASGQIVVTTTGGALTTAGAITGDQVQVYSDGEYQTLAADNNAAIFLFQLAGSSLDTAVSYVGGLGAQYINGLAAVATSGSYTDLSNKPTIPSAYTLPTASSSVTGGVKVGSGVTITDGVISVSTAYAASSHTHTASSITDFASAVASASPAEVLEYTTSASFPATGSTGKIYVATDSSRAYRWTGAAYAEVGPAGAYLPTHTHAASDIVSGTIATARLGSGTPSSANYLRGDGAWNAPTASDVGAAASCAVYTFTPTSKPASATGSNGNYSWSLPTGAKMFELLMIGAGAGGGSGRRGAAGTARYGGGGGGAGNATVALVDAAGVSGSLSILAPAGGAGGAAVTTDDTNGNAGSYPGSSAQVTFNSVTFYASSGNAGGGGTTTSGSAGTGSSIGADTFRSLNGASSSVSGTAGTTYPPAGLCGTCGAAGGGISSGNSAFSGGTMNLQTAQYLITKTSVSNLTAGSASTTAVAGSGPNAPDYGHGGCGGGASANGFNSGAGGNGGGGYVRITVWF